MPKNNAPPFHVLFLSGGRTSPAAARRNDNTSASDDDDILIERRHDVDDEDDGIDVDDYLHRRDEFRKKRAAASSSSSPYASSRQRRRPLDPEDVVVAAIARDDDDDGPSSSTASEDDRDPVGSVVIGTGGPMIARDARRLSSLRRMASPLEIAMAACCERHGGDDNAIDDRGGGDIGLHRPVFPANYVAPDDDGSSSSPEDSTRPSSSSSRRENICRRQRHRTETTSAATTTHHDAGGTCAGGVLRSGREVHFLKLLLMHCPVSALRHRALALAILQHTVDHRGEFPASSAVDDEAEVNTADARGGAMAAGTSSSAMGRIESFLAAGGMKLLARWFADACAVVALPQSDDRKKHASSSSMSSSSSQKHDAANRQRRAVRGAITSAAAASSPTGRLLLPLLHLLKCIPFDRELVVASGIHRRIKRLKKALSALPLAAQRDESVRLLDDVGADDSSNDAAHPVAGGFPVGRVVRAVDAVMESWTARASAVVSKSSSQSSSSPAGDGDDGGASKKEIVVVVDPFRRLRERINDRFDELVKFQREDAIMGGGGGCVDPPEWLPRSILGVWRAHHRVPIRRPGMAPTHPDVSSSSSSARPAMTDANDRSPGTQLQQRQPEPAEFRTKLEHLRRTAAPGPLFLGKRKVTTAMLIESRGHGPASSAKMMIPPTKLPRSSSTKRVSWTDRPISKNVSPGPLREERIFAKDSQASSAAVLRQEEDEESIGSAVRGEGHEQKEVAYNIAMEEEEEKNIDIDDDDSDMEDLF